ncbi:MAG: histidine phosphatase family protein [Thermus sp.]|nr:histidine phosphatase family protein [Thermus oshimai]
MTLFLVRHAPAEPLLEGQEDAARPLTPQGERRFRKAVRGLKRLGLRCGRVYHSPLLRAVQTAELLLDWADGPSEVTPLLAAPPGEELLELLATGENGVGVALVGHEPWLSQLAAWLLLGERAGEEAFVLKKGGVVWLEGVPRPGGMRLRAWLPPRVLRKVGG